MRLRSAQSCCHGPLAETNTVPWQPSVPTCRSSRSKRKYYSELRFKRTVSEWRSRRGRASVGTHNQIMSSSPRHLLLLLLAALPPTFGLRSDRRLKSPMKSPTLLRLRGGLLVPPAPVGMVASGLGLVSGLYCGLQPTAACGAYGISNPSAATARMTRLLGATNVAQGTLGVAAICGLATSTAIGISQAPLVLVSLWEAMPARPWPKMPAGTLQGAYDGGGLGRWTRHSPLVLVFAFSLATAMACSFGTAVPACASLCGAATLLTCGLPAALAPRWVAARVLVPHEDEKDDAQWRGMLQNVGNQLSSFAVLQVGCPFDPLPPALLWPLLTSSCPSRR